MKRLIFIVSIFFLSIEITVFSVNKPRMTKTVEPHYSGISGRRFYIPSYEEQNPEPIVINIADLDESAYFINPNNPQIIEDIAIDRNRRMRARQLLRSSKKPSGSEAYYFIGEAGLPEGVPQHIENL